MLGIGVFLRVFAIDVRSVWGRERPFRDDFLKFFSSIRRARFELNCIVDCIQWTAWPVAKSLDRRDEPNTRELKSHQDVAPPAESR